MKKTIKKDKQVHKNKTGKTNINKIITRMKQEEQMFKKKQE